MTLRARHKGGKNNPHNSKQCQQGLYEIATDTKDKGFRSPAFQVVSMSNITLMDGSESNTCSN